MAVMDNFERVQSQCSMDYWWPRLRDVDVPTPETVRLDIETTEEYQGGLDLPLPGEKELTNAIRQVGGPPAFLRSDLTSTKHDMGKGSRIEDIDTARSYVAGVVENHHLAWGMPMPSSYYVREWLKLYHEYSAWAYDHHDFATPVAAELRFFLNEGEVYDYGFYWPEDAITRPSRDDWREGHKRVKATALEDVRLRKATEYAKAVADAFDTGYWSVDFALTESDQWNAIDMARGEFSWHPDGVDQVRDRSDLVEDAEARNAGGRPE